MSRERNRSYASFDFNNSPEESQAPECTYEIFMPAIRRPPQIIPCWCWITGKDSLNIIPTGPLPILSGRQPLNLKARRNVSADILKIDARFVSLLKWLGENHINVRLSGASREDGYAVYKIREIAFGGGSKLSAEDGFLQFMIERLLSSDAPSEELPDEDEERKRRQHEADQHPEHGDT